MKYYFDTCIWRDYFENRTDRFRPLGEWALKLINKIIEEGGLIIFSNLVEEELKEFYSEEKLKSLLGIVPAELLVIVKSSVNQVKEARRIAGVFKVPHKGMCIASSKFSTQDIKELRSRRERPLATLVDNIYLIGF